MPKTVLLTGAGGSIGCHTLIHILHNTDWNVVVVDSFRHKGWQDRVKEVMRLHQEYNPRVKVITHDLTAPFSDLTKKKIGKIDYIISMASLSDVEESIQDPVPFCLNNVSLILNLLEYARECKPDIFLQISTDEVYGPTTGKDDGYREWDRKIPSNPYASSKSAQEEFCIGWWKAYGVPLILTNTMNNFGEMQSGSKYPVMIQKALAKDEVITIHSIGDEIGSRSYIHSRNFADALLFLLKNVKPHLHTPGQVDIPDRFHIAGDKQVNNKELVELIAKLMGKSNTFKYEMLDVHSTRPGHDPHYGLKAEKIAKLGWKAPVSFEESLAETIKWQTENNEWIQ
jgi:dTDP-glucose 4,6-dehydratase